MDPEGDPDNDISPIVLVDRGGCSFVRKSKNVQELGGALTIIVDTRDNSSPESVIMIDDGTGSNVAIPTLMISKEDGAKIKESILKTEESIKKNEKKEYTVLMIDFELPKPDDRVEYDIWYSSYDIKALDFIVNMNKYHKRLGSHALMTPHIPVQQCKWCSTEEVMKNCISYERINYCPPPLKDNRQAGTQILRAGIREHCIYTIYKDSAIEKWWNYMEGISNCRNSRFSDACTNQVLRDASIDAEAVRSCEYGKDMEILKEEFGIFEDYHIAYNPALVVNNHTYRVFSSSYNCIRELWTQRMCSRRFVLGSTSRQTSALMTTTRKRRLGRISQARSAAVPSLS